MLEQALAQVCKVPIGISSGRDALVHLHYVNVLPREVFPGERAQHLPWSMAAANRHDKTPAIGHGIPRNRSNQNCRLVCDRIGISVNLNLHSTSLSDDGILPAIGWGHLFRALCR